MSCQIFATLSYGPVVNSPSTPTTFLYCALPCLCDALILLVMKVLRQWAPRPIFSSNTFVALLIFIDIVMFFQVLFVVDILYFTTISHYEVISSKHTLVVLFQFLPLLFLLGRGLVLLILDLAETKEPVEETADLDVEHVSDGGGGDCDNWRMRRKQ